MRLGSMALLGAAALAILGACARNAEFKRPFSPVSSHVSPPPVQVPQLPPGTFDQAAASAALAAAQADAKGGNAAKARTEAERAVTLWPGDAASWRELAADCRTLGDDSCALYADFFGAKVEFLATQPPRAGVLGFATLATGKVGTRSGDYVYDQKTIDTALRLASFYDQQDTMRAARGPRLRPTTQLSPSTSRIE